MLACSAGAPLWRLWRSVDLLFAVEHGEGEDEVVLGGLLVHARVLDHLDEFLELQALAAVGETWHLARPLRCLLLLG